MWAVIKANAYGHGIMRIARGLGGAGRWIRAARSGRCRAPARSRHRAAHPAAGRFLQPRRLARNRGPPAVGGGAYDGTARLAGSQYAAVRRAHSAVPEGQYRHEPARHPAGACDAGAGASARMAARRHDRPDDPFCRRRWRTRRRTISWRALHRSPRRVRRTRCRWPIRRRCCDFRRRMRTGCAPASCCTAPVPATQYASAGDIGLKPVMRFEARIIAVQHLQAGDRVGYGGTLPRRRDAGRHRGLRLRGRLPAARTERHAGGHRRPAQPAGRAGVHGHDRGRSDRHSDSRPGQCRRTVGPTCNAGRSGCGRRHVNYELVCALALRVPAVEVGAADLSPDGPAAPLALAR
jgi:hypothetical protein